MITGSRVRRALACALTVAAFTPAVAVAQEDGVTVDPDSPSGKEYALPIDRARRQGDPRRPGRPVKPGAPAPLFGAGIGDGGEGDGSSSTGGTGGSGGEGKRGRSSGESARGASRSRDELSRLPRRDEVSRLATSGPGQVGGLPPSLLFGGLGAILLAAGTGIGLMLRRRQRG